MDDFMQDGGARLTALLESETPAAQLLARISEQPGAILVYPDADHAPRWHAGERFHHLFEDRLSRFGDEAERRIAISAEEEVSFAELDRRANQLARHLVRSGVAAGDRVGILLTRSVWSYVAMLAVSKAGAAWVPLDRGFPADRIAYIVEDAQVRLMLSVSELDACLEGLDIPVLHLDRAAAEIAAEPADRIPEDAGRAPDGLSYIIYTSGSTGRPKGVACNHSSICNFIKVAAEVYGLEAQDRVYQGMTIAFDFSFEEIWVPLFVGATLIPAPAEGTLLGPDLAEFLTERRITALCCVPTLLATLDEDLPELRFVLVSGEACPAQLVERWHRLGRVFLNVYGPTEAAVTATWARPAPGRPMTIGRPLPTYSVVILDAETGEALPQGAEGEITIGGIALAEGYVNRPDQTQRSFIPDFLGLDNNPTGRLYRTGDLGRITAEGEIEYLGRIDTQVKIRGYRIELAEIESVIMQVPGISQAVVAPFETAPGAMELVAYYTCRQDTEPLRQDEILGRLRMQLPSYMLPAFFEKMSALPMLPSNKVDRKRLPAPMGPRQIGRKSEFVAPESREEAILSDLLAELLGLERVSVEDHFFDDLGANSLMMARFCGAIRREIKLSQISIKDVYLSPTIRKLAPRLRALSDDMLPEQPAMRTHVATNAAYFGCAVAQVAFFCIFASIAAVAILESLLWTAHGASAGEAFLRALTATSVLLPVAITLPILIKWTFVGRFKPEEIPVWSAAYFRFWFVKAAIRANPLALMTGTPIFNFYLRMLGAKVGRHAVLACRMPAAVDLLTVGDGAMIRTGAVVNCYRAASGLVTTGRIEIGRNAFIGESTVLDIETRVGEGAQLGHTSSLQRGQSIPDGKRFHGSPAEETATDYCALPPAACGSVRRALYSALLMGLMFVGTAVAIFLGEYLFSTMIFDLSEPTAAELTPVLLADIAALATLVVLGWTLIGVGLLYGLPRLFARWLPADTVFPLYGVRYFVAGVVSRASNSIGYNALFGDSSFIVPYLKFVGYRLDPVVQTGSNFGLAQMHDMPLMCGVGPGTLVSDGLRMSNSDMSNSSFRLSHVSVGAQNFLGNNILYPHDAKVGPNCLLATKVMVPIDGPVRENTGLLGSPCFEIPRAVLRDRSYDQFWEGPALAERLRLKNRANAKAIGLLLLARFGLLFIAMMGAVLAAIDYLTYGFPVLLIYTVVLPVFVVGYLILLERASIGFGQLQPKSCSIYDEYYWTHERYWKFSLTGRDAWLGLLSGTPLKGFVLRLLGVRVGKRLFDDGCWISEKTMVEIGDDCTLAELSTVQGHSLEEAVFKSDRIRIGDRCTIGCNAFVHYGVETGDDVLVDPDSFLMKGSVAPAGTHWRGNPARQIR